MPLFLIECTTIHLNPNGPECDTHYKEKKKKWLGFMTNI